MSGKVWVPPHHGPGTITDHMPPCVHPGRRSWADGGEGGGRLALRGGSRRQAGPEGRRAQAPGVSVWPGANQGAPNAEAGALGRNGPAGPSSICLDQLLHVGARKAGTLGPRRPQRLRAPPYGPRAPLRGPARRHPSARAHAHSWAPRLVLGRRSRILHLPRPAHQPRQRRRRVAIPAAYLPRRSAPGPAASPPRPQSTRGRPWRPLTLAPLPSTSRKMTLRRRRRRKARSRGLRC